jgi:hypothetical protein
LILVDDHRPDPLVKIVSAHHTGDYAEFGAHALGEVERGAALHLRERDLEARGGFCADQGGAGGGNGRLGTARRRGGIKRGENVLDPLARKQRRDRRATRRQRPATGILRMGGQCRLDGVAATQRLHQVRKSRRGHPMGSNASRHAVRGIEALAGERAIAAELSRQTRQDKGRSDVGKEADPDLGHGEGKLVAGDAM